MRCHGVWTLNNYLYLYLYDAISGPRQEIKLAKYSPNILTSIVFCETVWSQTCQTHKVLCSLHNRGLGLDFGKEISCTRAWFNFIQVERLVMMSISLQACDIQNQPRTVNTSCHYIHHKGTSRINHTQSTPRVIMSIIKGPPESTTHSQHLVSMSIIKGPPESTTHSQHLVSLCPS